MKKAIFTGSFDPITLGHIDLIRRASEIFGEVIVAVGTNPSKTHLFTIAERIDFIRRACNEMKNVVVTSVPAGKLSTDYAYEQNGILLKGVRLNADFDYEKMMHEINHVHQIGGDTLILPAQSTMNHISSSATKEICKLNGDTHKFVTLDVKRALERKLTGQYRLTITGIIGAGKSTIVDEIIKRAPFEVHNIDMDLIAHDILFLRREPIYLELRKNLKIKFGLTEWNRKSLGNLVFARPLARTALNEAIRIPLRTRIRERLNGLKGLIIFNGALMIEAGWLHLSNYDTVLLHVPADVQAKRLSARGHDAEQIERRVNAQKSTNEKLAMIHGDIENCRRGATNVIDTSVDSAEQIADFVIEKYGPPKS